MPRRPYLAATALALALVASCSLTRTARGAHVGGADVTASVDQDERPQPVPVVEPASGEPVDGLPQGQRLPILPALRVMLAPTVLAPDDVVAALRPAGALEPRELVRRVPTARCVPRPPADEPG